MLQRWDLIPCEQDEDGAAQCSRASLCPAHPSSWSSGRMFLGRCWLVATTQPLFP